MAERPILFSGPLVRAILAGRKTQTRRVVRLGDHDRAQLLHADPVHGVATFGDRIPDDPVPVEISCPYGSEGDRLWVREAFRLRADQDDKPPRLDWWKSGAWYAADGPSSLPSGCAGGPGKLRPSIHMPRWASRIDLEVTEVRIERLQAITAEDAIAEGLEVHVDEGATYYGPLDRGHADARQAFAGLWDSINGKREGCSWAANPWVWVVGFKVLEVRGG